MTGEVAFYSPDTDPTILGTLTNVNALVPSLKGYKGAPSAMNAGLPALPLQVQGALSLKKPDNTSRFIIGTATKLYEAAASSWTDVSRVGAYGLASDARWSFAQYGTTSLAANKADLLQFSNSGAFADVAASPRAAYVEVANNFTFLANTNEAIYGDSPDRVIWSALGSFSDYVASIATQAGTTRLTSRPGPIVGIKRFSNGIVVYKQNSMYAGTYVGAPNLWSFQDVPGEIGAVSNNVIVPIGTPEDPKHIFMGAYDFYQFDGARPVPIGSPLKETVFSEINRNNIGLSTALHDVQNSRVYFYYCSGGSSLPDKCVVYNYKTNKWGRDDQMIECAAEYIVPSLTYGGFGTLYSTYGDAPNVSYGSSLFSSASLTPSIFKTDHILYTISGASAQSTLTTGDIGDEINYKLLRRIKPQFISAPASATLTNYYRDSLGAPLTTDFNVNMSNYRFDFLRSARWHRINITFSGDVELNSLIPDYTEAGSE
ncbi:MAG: hypothetical protein V4605_09545 [Pseudomonadota bacterium]